MILLFSGMQSSLSLVYDREMGSMRLLLTSPMPRWWLLFCRLLAGSLIAVLQAYAFLAIAALYGIRFPWAGYLLAAPAMAEIGRASCRGWAWQAGSGGGVQRKSRSSGDVTQ